MPLRRQRTLRAASRGAALVEAAVVIPVMLVFLGTIMFTFKSYNTKLDKQTTLRAGTLYFASHACEGQAPQGIGTNAQNIDTGGDQSDANNGGSKLDPSVGAGLNRNWNSVSANIEGVVVSGSAVNDRRTVHLERTVSAFSAAGCNEKSYQNNWTAIFKFVPAYAKSGGGFID